MHAPPSHCLSWKRKVLSFKHTALAPLVSPAKTTLFLEEARNKTSIRDVRSTNSTSARAHIVDIAADHRCRHRATRCGGALVAPRSFSFQSWQGHHEKPKWLLLGAKWHPSGFTTILWIVLCVHPGPPTSKVERRTSPGVRQGRNKAHCRW